MDDAHTVRICLRRFDHSLEIFITSIARSECISGFLMCALAIAKDLLPTLKRDEVAVA
jgi:hypothetical protein